MFHTDSETRTKEEEYVYKYIKGSIKYGKTFDI